MAGAHAAARKKLGLIRTFTTESGHLANPARADLFASADDHLVGGLGDPGWWRVQRIQERASTPLALQFAAQWPSQGIALPVIETPLRMGCTQRGQRAAQFGRTGAGNRGSVTCNPYTLQ